MRHAMSRRIEGVLRWWAAERDRRFLWLPVVFAAGIALYYALPFEPETSLLWKLAGASAVLAGGARLKVRRLRPAGLVLLLVALGALSASLHTARQGQVMITESLSPRPVRGVVQEIERTEHGVRLTLAQVRIADISANETPARVRLTVRPKKDSTLEYPRIGDTIWMMAGVLPPMGPALPGGFDFARYFFFRDIGAVGFGLPPWHVVDAPKEDSVATQFMDWRFRLTDRIIDTLGTRNGPIAAGLITGEARAITEDDFDALKASNLYHIIAISGGHMVVIAGVIYLGLRLLFLLAPGGLANRPLGKSLAALVTLVLTTTYLAVTGMPISAVRAYAMIVLVLLAVVFMRRVQPMRSLALAFWLMLIIDPSDLLEPGFQLSFAATLAIVALVEHAWFRSSGAAPESAGARIRRFIVFSVLISVVAELATLPLVVAMFNNLSIYGIVANVAATPLVSFLLMPVVALFFVLLPLGLEHWALMALNHGIDALLWIAHHVATLPYAQQFLPSLPGWGVGLFVVGLCWICLWQQAPRYLGVFAIVAGLASVATVRLPDVLISPNATQIALRTEHGYMQAKGRASSMIAELWSHGVGQPSLLRRDDAYVTCAGGGCEATLLGKTLVFATRKTFDPVARCQTADIVISDTVGACPLGVVIPKTAPLRALWLETPLRMESSADWQGQRPWSVKPLIEDDV